MSFTKHTVSFTRGIFNRLRGSRGTTKIDVKGRSEGNSAADRAAEIQEMLHISVPGCRLISILGFGGMGTVFLAKQENLDRLVAVKMLNRDLVDQPEFTESLLREARIMGGFSHPNLVNCHDVIHNMDGVFIIMEYIPGHFSGRDIVKKLGPIPELYLVRSLISVCHALDYINCHGFLHLDMKPDNLLFYQDTPKPPQTMADVFDRPSSRVAVCDFGIAMQLKDVSKVPSGEDASVMGSPYYMAPEQLLTPDKVDFRADMYALASTSWYFLTGEDPWEGLTEEDMLRAKVREDFDAQNRFDSLKTITPHLAHILRKMGRLDPSSRYESYDALIRDLTSLEIELVHESSKSHPITDWFSRHMEHFIYTMVIIVAMILVGLGIYLRYLQRIENSLKSEWTSITRWAGSFEGWNRQIYVGDSHSLLRGYTNATPLHLNTPLQRREHLYFQMKCYDDGEVNMQLLVPGEWMDVEQPVELATIKFFHDDGGYTVALEEVRYDEGLQPTRLQVPTPTSYLNMIKPPNIKMRESYGWVEMCIERYNDQCRIWSGKQLLGVLHMPEDSEYYGLTFQINGITCRMTDFRNVIIQNLKK